MKRKLDQPAKPGPGEPGLYSNLAGNTINFGKTGAGKTCLDTFIQLLLARINPSH